jgi:hypothetical protein
MLKRNANTVFSKKNSKKALAYAVRSVGGCFCVQDLVNLFLIYQVYSGESAACFFIKKKKSVGSADTADLADCADFSG